MNINYLNFFEIGDCISEFAINNRVSEKIYGFCLEEDKTTFDKLRVRPNINKLYYSYIEKIDIDNLISIYNIIAIDYLKINMSKFNYSLMSKFLKNQRPLLIDKIEIGYLSDKIHFQEISKELINNNYSLIYSKERHFFLANSSISRLIINPDELDLIFIKNIKKIENI